MTRPTKKIVCRVRVDEAARAVEFTWSEGSASFKPYSLQGDQVADFRTNVRTARDRLFGLVHLHEQPLDRRDPVSYRQACLDLARTGHDLYNQVFDAAARGGEHVDTIAGWFRDVSRTGQVESLEVVCEGQPWFAPWNLVYDEEPEESAFDDTPAGFAPFWGYRYNVCGGQPVDPLRRMPLPTKPRILVVVDPVVLDDLQGYANADGTNQRDRLERFLAERSLTPVTSAAELARALKQRPHVIYWLGHAEPDALHLGPDRIDQVNLRNLLRNMTRVPGHTGGLVFLNACRTAESGDLGSFLKTFHDAMFSGLIATEEQTLDTFANAFGLDLLEQFFTPGTSIGGLLRDLRQRHSPLGLLYGAYCPPDLHLRVEEEPGAQSTVRPAEDATRAGARFLGGSRVAPAGAEAGTHDRPLPDVPYLPLDSYGRSHRPLFIGRDDDVARFAMIFDRPESRVLVLHGESGVGKSSFLRAGLIPYLEEDGIGYRFLRDRSHRGCDESASPVLFIRATDDPAGQISQTLIEFAARPLEYVTPTGETVVADLPAELAAEIGATQLPTAADLSQRLLADTSLLALLLGRLSRALPVTPVLVIDQAEEMFTLARSPVDAWSRDRVLDMIRKVGDGRGDFKLIVALRTEYYGRLVSALRRGLAEADGVRDYLLTDLEEPVMVEVIRRPTSREHLPHALEIPFERYRGFDYADGVPEEIARQVARHGRTDGVALLLQVICAQLFERAMARDDHRVSEDDLREIGGFEGALSRHAERQIAALLPESKSDRERFQVLLTCLALSQVDGTLTTALLVEEKVRGLWDGRTSFEELLARACELRLLRTTSRKLDLGSEERLISLGHDALAKVAYPWKRELERRAERRKWRIRGALTATIALIFAAFSWSLSASNRKIASANRLLGTQNAELQIARDKASDSAAESREVLRFFEERLLSAARPEGEEGGLGTDVTLRRAIDDAEPHISQEFQNRPLVEASVRWMIGNTYSYLGEPPLAIRQHERALALREAALAADHPDTMNSRHDLAVAYREAGMLDLSIGLFQRTLEDRRSGLGVDHPDTLRTQNGLALAYLRAGRADEATSLLERTLEVRRARLGPDHPKTLISQNNLGYVYQRAGKFDQAIELLQRTLEVQMARLNADHPNTLFTQDNIAIAHRDAGRLDLAIPLFERTLKARIGKLGENHPHTLESRMHLAEAYRLARKPDLAIPHYGRILEAREAKLGAVSPVTLAARHDLASAYLDSGRYDLAIPHFEQIAAIRVTSLGPDHADTFISQDHLAIAYKMAGKPALAIPLLERRWEAESKSCGPDHPDTLATMERLAFLYSDEGRFDRAEPMFRRLWEERTIKPGPDDKDTINTENEWGVCLAMMGRREEAERHYLQSLTGIRKAQGVPTGRVSTYQRRLVELYDDWRKPARAAEFLLAERSLSGVDDPGFAKALAGIGSSRLRKRMWSEAEVVLRECLGIRERKPPEDWCTFNIRSELGGSLLGQKRYAEAEPLILSGYERLKARARDLPPQGKAHLTEAGERVILLYEAWGKAREAEEWRARIKPTASRGRMSVEEFPDDPFAPP